MPQCGLAPGFISILAYHLTRPFDVSDTVHMRVGALPQFPSNALNYNLTWSTDGLINEYCNPCQAIHEGRLIEALPLDGLESFSLDGVRYEAFNTSGGLGTLCETLDGRVRELNYRTIRYRGHRDLMAFLLDDLRLGQRREVLKDILEHAIPITLQDVVVIFCNVTGWQDGPVRATERRAEDLQPDDRRPDLERDPDHHRRRGLRGAWICTSPGGLPATRLREAGADRFRRLPRQPLRPLLRQPGRRPVSARSSTKRRWSAAFREISHVQCATLLESA